jgi:hypothetical protein
VLDVHEDLPKTAGDRLLGAKDEVHGAENAEIASCTRIFGRRK